MDFASNIKALANTIKGRLPHIATEEATKTALIMPFLQTLGYDIFNPSVVIPEFTADVGSKKGEKVDYAIQLNNEIVVLIEAKTVGDPLDASKASQLRRYFHTITTAKIGVLTDGVIYKFFTDLDNINIMDGKPFLTLDMNNLNDSQIALLQLMCGHCFNQDTLREHAEELKHVSLLSQSISEEINNPSPELVKIFARKVLGPSSVITAVRVEQFREKLVKGFDDYINTIIRNKFDRVLQQSEPAPSQAQAPATEPEKTEESKKQVITTEEEVEGYAIVKTILREVIDPKRVFIRDTLSYCGVLLDNTNLKTICRLHFNAASTKYIGTINVHEDKKETRHLIQSVDDIYNFADLLKQTVRDYLDTPKDTPLAENQTCEAPERSLGGIA